MPRQISERPRFTEAFDSASFTLVEPSVFITGRSDEERSLHVEELAQRSPGSRFIDVVDQRNGTISIDDNGTTTEVSLRSTADLAEIWGRHAGVPYLDITGLPHNVWAPLLRAAFIADADIRLVYVEPMRYRFNRIRTEGELFDLSVRFDGIGPLPGFLSLAEPSEDEVVLVTLLGFEGPRFSMVLNHVQIPREQVIPVVGVPGFQPEFVYYAYHGNRLPLEETGAWMSIQYATANCPFSAFYTLDRVAGMHEGSFIKVAPIGTKPHSVGAVLFAMANPDRVEIIYDHPVRREGRTSGAARLLVYHVHALSSELSLR